MANENLKKWLAGGYVEAPDFLKELKNVVNEIDYLKETVRIYKVCDELTREHSKKVKHVFPLENTAGYGQLCDKVVEQEKEIELLKDFARDCYMNWDCDSDAHKYNTVCRSCEAEKLYKPKSD